jgi:hypothetical protein
MPTNRSAAAFALFLAPLVAGCGGSDPIEDSRSKEIARLTAAVEGLTASNENLGNELRRQARQLNGLSRDLAASRSASSGVSAALQGESDEESADEPPGPTRDGVDQPSGEPAAGLGGESEVDALLATEAGRKVIQKAAAKEIAKREERDRRTFVSYAIGVFARDAGLDEHQTRELQRIWKESLDGGAKLRKQFAAVGALPEGEREAGRAKAMESMRDLGRRREEQVSKLLTAEQLDAYEKTEEEIVASLHGRPSMPSSRPEEPDTGQE